MIDFNGKVFLYNQNSLAMGITHNKDSLQVLFSSNDGRGHFIDYKRPSDIQILSNDPYKEKFQVLDQNKKTHHFERISLEIYNKVFQTNNDTFPTFETIESLESFYNKNFSYS